MPQRRKPQSRKPTKPPGIREIAEKLRVSIGTVDRALHDRPGINPATRGKILELARSLGYRPNLAARFLSSRRQLRIGVNLPREIASFFDQLRGGIQDAARGFESSGVTIVSRTYPRLGQGESEALAEALKDELDGLIIAPGQPEELAPLMRRAAEKGLPVVCVNTDAPGVEHLCTVSVDSTTNGSLVGELMGRFLGGKGRIVVVTGQLDTTDHARKLEGFRRALVAMWPGVDVATVIEAHDEEAEAYEKCREVLRSTADVAGVYVSTANSLPVMRALEERPHKGQVTVVTTDLFPALAPLIESGRIAATIHQRPAVQGQIAFQTLYRFLVEGAAPAPAIQLSPHIVMRSNLKIFLERIGSGPAAEPGRDDAHRRERAAISRTFVDR
jgi:LacI family transcriptional regulator